MSLATIRTGLYTTLTACGPYGQAEVSSCDFGILESISGCAVVFHPSGESELEPLTFKATDGKVTTLIKWPISGEVYLRFGGDSQALLSRAWSALDDIRITLAKDVTLANSACFAYLKSIRYDIAEGYDLGGVEFGVVHFMIEAQDIDAG